MPQLAKLPIKEITFDAPIEDHVAWAFEHIYSIPYPSKNRNLPDSDIARYYHGITHVTGALVYAPVLANLFASFGDSDAKALTPNEIKLIQVALLFHDAAREGEEEDLWDQESALMLYYYLTKTLNVDPRQAKLLAEAVANKDSVSGSYNALEISPGAQEAAWVPLKNQPKNIYQKIIHDADCLEVIRARPHFKAENLDFYKDFAEKNQKAFDVMAELITEVRSLIALRGDSYANTKPKIKEKYEHQNAYKVIMNDIAEARHNPYVVLGGSYNLGNSDSVARVKFDQKKGLTTENLHAAIKEGRVLIRGIPTPSAVRIKDGESLAETEIYKMRRRPGVTTRTKKKDALGKNGNDRRSTSLIGYGASVYANAGFLIIDFNIDGIRSVNAKDVDTGRWKKPQEKTKDLSQEAKIEQLAALRRMLKMGGDSKEISGARNGQNIPSTHTEVEYLITSRSFGAIYFTPDPCIFNMHSTGVSDAVHKHSPILQAIFLQTEHERLTGERLPIFMYSGLHNSVKEFLRPSDDQIVRLWEEMAEDYL